MAKLKMPQTVDEYLVLQPNNVTFGRYDYTATQENVITLVSEALQDYMTKGKEIPRDLFNQPYVEISAGDAADGNNKFRVLKEVQGMMRKTFQFKWVHPEVHKTIETTGVVVSTVHSIKGTDRIVINFNPWVIPFLIYYGKGVGGTWFNPALSVGLKSEYAKRIYKIICSQKDKRTYVYWITDVIKDFELEDKPALLDNSAMKKRIFEVAKKKIDASGSPITFDFEFLYKGVKQPNTKHASNCVVLHIKDSEKKKKPDTIDGQMKYNYCLSLLYKVWGNFTTKAMVVCDRFNEEGKISELYDKLFDITHWYNKKMTDLESDMTEDKYFNTVKKRLREDYGIE
jgi:hypothetical protein